MLTAVILSILHPALTQRQRLAQGNLLSRIHVAFSKMRARGLCVHFRAVAQGNLLSSKGLYRERSSDPYSRPAVRLLLVVPRMGTNRSGRWALAPIC